MAKSKSDGKKTTKTKKKTKTKTTKTTKKTRSGSGSGSTAPKSTAKPAKPAKPAKSTPASSRSRGVPTLAGVREALAAGDEAAALRDLLAIHAQTPAPGIALAIARVGARAAATVQPPTGKTPKERHAAWALAAERGDPVVRHTLFATVNETRGCADTLARIELLVPHGDPRLVDRLADFVANPIYNASVHRTQLFWKRVFELLATDRRTLARAAEWPAQWAANKTLSDAERLALGRKTEQLASAVAELPDHEVDDPEALAAILATAQPVVDDRGAELLAAIYAAPADDAPRLVYADWLAERGDPRGEFIALQMLPDPTAEQAARMTELLAEHGARWLGRIAPYVVRSEMTFERGFLATCRLSETIGSGTGLRDDLPSPEWATVHTIRGGIPATPAHPMPALRAALDIDTVDLQALAALSSTPPLRTIGWTNGYRRLEADGSFDQTTRAAIAAFEQLDLPDLRRLELRGSDLWSSGDGMSPERMTWPWQKVRSLTELAIGSALNQFAAWVREVASAKRLLRFELVTQAGPNWNTGWVLAANRPSGGDLEQLQIIAPEKLGLAPQTLPELTAGLALLPPDRFQRITVLLPSKRVWHAAPEDDREAFAAALARQTRVTEPAIQHHAR